MTKRGNKSLGFMSQMPAAQRKVKRKNCFFWSQFGHNLVTQKKHLTQKWAKCLILLVPGPGFEPGTHGFSVRCSTD